MKKIKKKKINNKETIQLTPEEMEKLRQRNEMQRIRNAYIKKRKEEIDFAGGIVADNYDKLRIYRLEVSRKTLNFIGDTMQKIVNVFNKRFVKEKNDFWYNYIFKKYEIPKELPMTYKKIEDGKGFVFVIPKENENN